MSETAPPDLQQSIEAALFYAVTGESEQAIEHLADIAGWGPRGIFTAVCGWSAVSLMGLTGDMVPDRSSFYSLEVSKRDTGQVVDASKTSLTPAERTAAQMITLYGNRDHDTMIAFITEAWDKDCGTSLMTASLSLAAASAKSLKKNGETDD